MSDPLRVALLALVGLATGAAALLAFGRARWKRGTSRLRGALDAGRIPILPARVDFADLCDLPSPVQRYLRRVLTDGGAMVAGVEARHTGSMNMSETSMQWKKFTSDQYIVVSRPGFDWNARIRMLPGVDVLVHDSYIGGEGRLLASLSGLVKVAGFGGTQDMAQGELMRFFAESVWYPTAWLPGQGIIWEAIDAHSARATLIDGAISVSLVFRFDEDGLVEGVRAQARGRTAGGKIIPTPWVGRFWDYQKVDGMLVPFGGEVAWELPDGPAPYWRGEVTGIVYTLVE